MTTDFDAAMDAYFGPDGEEPPVDWGDVDGAAPQPVERQPAPRTWAAQDLASVLDGSYQPPKPSVGRRDDGVGLFYPGRMNSVASESEAGKTWFALIACLQEINDGNHVLYLDFEDDAGGVVGRLLCLGAHPDDVLERFHYVRPENTPSDIDLLDLALVLEHSPTLAIVDGVTEGMSLFGLELKDNTDIAKFGRLLLRPLMNAGAAVVTLDHVVKSSENRGRYSIGGVHKLNGLNGVMYILENRRPFGIGLTGKSTIRVAKDRPAQIRKNGLPHSSGMHWFADLVVKSESAEFAEAHLYAPVQRDEEDRQEDEERKRLDGIKRKVLEAIGRAKDPLTGKGIEDRVTGRAADVRRAVAELIDSGHIAAAPGPRNSTLHSLPNPSQSVSEQPAA
ncbi:AAA domain-containing protein [Streptomyces sp. 2231.1]|uniref:AAA family ATPase n=1 Tax=Streptomyces sp. 2231.1 TaxID=1855347 RepID=UPI000896D87D|nr:AAA family ATPase [Streptomyces sp. 2231.1]SED26162.1 AAA domain-containing protein [Streptomyces sp. 2231.1]